MLNKALVVPTIPVTDLDRSRKFYADKLGLKLLTTTPQHEAVFEVGSGTLLMLYQRPSPTKADQTVASFVVDSADFDSTVKDLRSKGVIFEEYDIPEMNLKTHNGIATIGDERGAWFKDPDGNILAIAESETVSRVLRTHERAAATTLA